MSILILLGIMKFGNHVQNAQIKRIQNDVKVMESVIEEKEIKSNLYDSFEESKKNFELLIYEKKLFDKKGYVKEFGNKRKRIIPEEYKNEIKTSLNGTFYITENRKVYYESDYSIGDVEPIPSCDSSLEDRLNYKGPIIFCGLSEEAHDGDETTYYEGTGDVHWIGDLKLKSVYLNYNGSISSISILDKNNKAIPFINLETDKEITSISTQHVGKILMPEDAVKIRIVARNGYKAQVNELQAISPFVPDPVSKLKHTTTSSLVNAAWEKPSEDHEKILIYKDDKFYGITKNLNFEDIVYSDIEHTYKIRSIDYNGNASEPFILNAKSKVHSEKITFRGLSPEAFDNNGKTSFTGNNEITWTGPLEDKAIYVNYEGGYSGMRILDKDGKVLPFLNLNTGKEVSAINDKFNGKLIVPKGARKIVFYRTAFSVTATIYDVEVLKNSIPKEINNLSSKTNSYSVDLTWEQNEESYNGAAIYKDDKFIKIVNGKTFRDIIYSDIEHKYKVHTVDKNGNISTNGKEIIIKSDVPSHGVIFRGLSPEAFDYDNETFHKGNGDVTWQGSLEGRRVFVKYTGGYTRMVILNKNDKIIPFLNLSTGKEVNQVGAGFTGELVIPKDAAKMRFARTGFSGTASIHEIQVLN